MLELGCGSAGVVSGLPAEAQQSCASASYNCKTADSHTLALKVLKCYQLVSYFESFS